MKKIIYFVIVTSAFFTPVSIFAIANPASVNCIDKGGVLEIRKDSAGAEYGMCVFKDETECEEWSLYGNTCASGQNKKGDYEKNKLR